MGGGVNMMTSSIKMAEEQEDELALLEAMKQIETEFQWEAIEGIIEGVMRIELKLPKQPMAVQLDPDSGIYRTLKTRQQGTLNRVITVMHLPPIKLHFQLQPNYPLEVPPSFSLSCSWLNFSQLSILCRHLDQIWSDNCGAAILHNWQQFLALETLIALNIDDLLTIKYQNPLPPQKIWDPRGVQEMKSLLKVIPILIEYDHQKKIQLFQSNRFFCEICLLTVCGSECVCVHICGHIYCKLCMQAHVSAKITEGNVTKIECPSSDCTELLIPGLIQVLVPQTLFERYDQLLLQRTLDGMKDIVRCPRPTCCCVTVREEDSNMVLCPSCKFAFCILCKRTWHGISPCKMLPDDMMKLKECYESGDDDVRKSMEQQYGHRYLIRAFQEFDSSKWIKSNTECCPKCRASIEKDHGCNKITCFSCNCHFCWLCNEVLPRHNPYSHYHHGNSSCGGKLFDGEIPDDGEIGEI